MSNDFSNLLRNVEALESIDDFSDEDQPLENLELFLALISSGKTSWRIRRMKRRRKQKGKQGRRKGQRATYTRRWITHDCLAWNYSISPPLARTTDYPPGLACSLRFHSIMHPASPTSHLLLLLPPSPLLLLFFRAWPRSDDVFSCETRRRRRRRNKESRKLDRPLPLRRQIWTDAFVSSKNSPERGNVDLSLCCSWMEATLLNEKRFFWWSRICIDSPIQQFTIFLVFDGRPFMASWTSRNSFEISNVWFYCEIVIFSSRLGIVKNITIHWKNNKEITIFVLLSLDSNRAG